MNVIKQIVKDGQYGTQTIKMIVKDSERGAQGAQGEPGMAATVEAGQAYSVPSTQQPSVVNTGSQSAAVFDFYIPRGEKGEKGADGVDGKDGAIRYKAGTGINITSGNVIEATGVAAVQWGGINGNIANQADLQAEFREYTKTSALAAVATSGSYNDLSNKPTIPAAQVNSDWNASSGKAQILNKPTIPTVNNATLTIKQNGTSVGTFTANASSNKTISFTTPVITLTDTDPGEGSALAANNFIAVYSNS